MLFSSRKETIHWALVALRALHRGDLRQVYGITSKLPAFPGSPDLPDLHATLTNYIGGLMNDDLGLEAREVEKADIPEEEKRRRLAHVRRRAGSWAQVQRRLVLHAVLREDGTPHPDQHSSARALADHWGPVFSGTGIDATEANNILEHVRTIPDDAVLNVIEDEFNGICDAAPATAPRALTVLSMRRGD